MRKIFLLLIPTTVLICCLAVNFIMDIKKIDIELIEFIIFIIAFYGILFVAPIYYMVIINLLSTDKKSFVKLTLCAVVYICLNAIIAGYDSILYYFNIKERGANDLDLLSAYIIVPFGIFCIELCITQVLKLIKNKS